MLVRAWVAVVAVGVVMTYFTILREDPPFQVFSAGGMMMFWGIAAYGALPLQSEAGTVSSTPLMVACGAMALIGVVFFVEGLADATGRGRDSTSPTGGRNLLGFLNNF